MTISLIILSAAAICISSLIATGILRIRILRSPRNAAGKRIAGHEDSTVQVIRGCAWCDQIDDHAVDCPIRQR